jgi:hypothetical protein
MQIKVEAAIKQRVSKQMDIIDLNSLKKDLRGESSLQKVIKLNIIKIQRLGEPIKSNFLEKTMREDMKVKMK